MEEKDPVSWLGFQDLGGNIPNIFRPDDQDI